VGLEGSRGEDKEPRKEGGREGGRGVRSFEKKGELLVDLLGTEREYVGKMRAFKEGVVMVLEKRDSEDKRRLKVRKGGREGGREGGRGMSRKEGI